ncbi:MAG: hypothetical protein AAGI68_15975 [Planctomycetota bacterium]
MGKQLGRDFKVYYSATLITDASDSAISGMSWVEAPTTADVNLDEQKAEITYATRENDGETQYFDGPFEDSIQLNLAKDKQDAFYQALKRGYKDKTPVALAVVDEDIDNPGAEGYAANFTVLRFPSNLELASVAEVQVFVRPRSFINRDYVTPAI